MEVDLSGWFIADKNKNRSKIEGLALSAVETGVVELDGKGAQLGNKGGIITLLNPAGVKIHGVSYTKSQAKEQGWAIVF